MKKVTIFALVALMMALTTACNNECSKSKEEPNEVIQTIMARRSIRQYKPEPVAREVMEQIVECGINAPNGPNRQSWQVRIIDNPALLAEMAEKMAEAHPAMDAEMVKGMFRGAPTMAFIARDKGYDFSTIDCGLLSENMILSAWSLGVGSICLGGPVRFLTDNELCKPYIEMLDFDDNYEFCLCIGFGYADEQPEAKPRDKSKVKFIDAQ